MTSCKILIACHKKHVFFESEIFTPIHVGRSIAEEKKVSDLQWLKDNMIGDNDGENISDKNSMFCEMTALYFAWKNYHLIGSPEYIGLMHYRRFFVFKKTFSEQYKKTSYEKSLSFCTIFDLSNYTKQRLGLSDEDVRKVCTGNDAVVVQDADFNYSHKFTVEEDYENIISGLNKKDLDFCIDVINRDYPEYSIVAENVLKGKRKLLYQMFIMKRELFEEYMAFAFHVLNALHDVNDFSDYSQNGKRTPGYIGEILLTIFIDKKSVDDNIKIAKLDAALFEKKIDRSQTVISIKQLIKLKAKLLFLSIKRVFKSDRNNYNKRGKILHDISYLEWLIKKRGTLR